MRGTLINVGKKLIGDGAEFYLPFAMSKLRYFASANTTFPFSRTIIADGALILLELRDAQYGQITITTGSPSYEFFATAPALETQDFAGFGVYRGYAVTVTRKKDKLRAKASGSTRTEGAWPFKTDATDMASLMRHKNLWQIQGIGEYVYYPAGKAFPFVVSTWATSAPTGGLYGRSGYSSTQSLNFDTAYDVAPSVFQRAAALTPLGENGLAPDADWYRRAAVRTVVHPSFGARTFIIMTDASNRFYAYPLVPGDSSLAAGSPYADQAIKTNVPSEFVRSQQAPLPSWARANSEAARDLLGDPSFTATEYLRQFAVTTWQFNSTATRAVTLAYRDLPTSTFVSGPLVGQHPGRVEDGTEFAFQEALPGLVEVNIALSITGPQPHEFTFGVTLRQQVDPQADDKYILAADYAWDISGAAQRDDLLIMTADIYDEFVDDVDTFTYEKDLVVITNQRTGAVVRQFNAGTNGTSEDASIAASCVLLAYDLRTLSFVVQASLTRNTFSGGGTLLSIQRAMKLETIAYNVVKEKQVLATDPALDVADHDFSITDRDWRRTSVNETGNAAARADYYKFYLSGGGYARYAGYTRFQLDAEIPGGAMIYARRFANFMTANSNETFAVHPEGHWSVVTNPSFCYNGLVENRINFSVPLDTLVDLSKFSQGFVDTVRYRYADSSGAALEAEATHIELFNQAYGDSLTPDSFKLLFTVEVDTFQATPTVSARLGYVKVTRPAQPEFTGYFLFAVAYKIGGSPDYVISEQYSLTDFDARTDLSEVFTDAKREIDFIAPSGAIVYKALASGRAALRRLVPVIRGSALFSTPLSKKAAT